MSRRHLLALTLAVSPLLAIGCARHEAIPTTALPWVAYDWPDRTRAIRDRALPGFTDAHLRTLDQALDRDRLLLLQAYVGPEYRQMGNVPIDDNNGVYEPILNVAVLPLVDLGPAAGPELLTGLRSERRYVRYAAWQALMAIYRVDIPHVWDGPPGNQVDSQEYDQWAEVVRTGQIPATQPTPPTSCR